MPIHAEFSGSRRVPWARAPVPGLAHGLELHMECEMTAPAELVSSAFSF